MSTHAKKSDLDAIDCRIIAALQADGRLTNVELADRVGLSPSPCLRRVKRLEREGYIEAYRAVLQRDRVGLGFSVFVGVKIAGPCQRSGRSPSRRRRRHARGRRLPLVSGEADYSARVVVPDLEHYRRFLVDKLLDLPIVREVRSNIAIQTVKANAPLPLRHLDAGASLSRSAARPP